MSLKLKGSPSSESSLPVPAPSEILTVGKLISRMLAEKIVLAKPTAQFVPESTLTPNSDYHLSSSSPKVEIVAPPDSPALNVNSTLTSATSTPRQFPTLIVVNPTPHPTPPATPSSEPSEKTFDISRSPMTAIHPPRLALGSEVTETVETSLSPSSNNDQLATPVSIGQPSLSINNHVTYEVSF